MKCLHCGKWNRTFQVSLKNELRTLTSTVVTLTPSTVEDEARKKWEEIGEDTWDLELDKIFELGEVTKE